MEWIQAHWLDVLNIVSYVVLAFSVIAKLTPNIWDDKVVAALIRLLSLAPKNPLNNKIE